MSFGTPCETLFFPSLYIMTVTEKYLQPHAQLFRLFFAVHKTGIINSCLFKFGSLYNTSHRQFICGLSIASTVADFQ